MIALVTVATATAVLDHVTHAKGCCWVNDRQMQGECRVDNPYLKLHTGLGTQCRGGPGSPHCTASPDTSHWQLRLPTTQGSVQGVGCKGQPAKQAGWKRAAALQGRPLEGVPSTAASQFCCLCNMTLQVATEHREA